MTERERLVEPITEAQIRAEAVKEFAERFENELSEKVEDFYFEEEHENFMAVNKVFAFFDNLVKEFTEEQK